MPQVIIKTGLIGSDGQQEILSEYLCDWPDCPNPAVHVLGFLRELGTCTAVCDDHRVAFEARMRNRGIISPSGESASR
jgi:hypothetical protein